MTLLIPLREARRIGREGFSSQPASARPACARRKGADVPYVSERHAHSATDAKGGKTLLRVTLLHFVQQRNQDPASGSALNGFGAASRHRGLRTRRLTVGWGQPPRLIRHANKEHRLSGVLQQIDDAVRRVFVLDRHSTSQERPQGAAPLMVTRCPRNSRS